MRFLIGALVALFTLAACGRSPLEPVAARTQSQAAVTVDGPCTITKAIVFVDRGHTYTLTLTAHYAVCPSDAVLAATGWVRAK